MKMGDLIQEDFQRALLMLGEKDLPVPASYKISIILENAEKMLKRYNNIRKKLLKSHEAFLQTNCRTYAFPSPREQEAYAKKYQKLVSLEIDIGNLTLEDLGDILVSPFIIKALRGKVLTT